MERYNFQVIEKSGKKNFQKNYIEKKVINFIASEMFPYPSGKIMGHVRNYTMEM